MRRSLVPDIVNLQAFECAARHQNFSRAAHELGLTQSAISRQIAELELQIGLKLFERIRQRVVLSLAGHRFLPEVRDLLIRSERLMIEAAASSDKIGTLRIATLPTFGTRWLIPRLGRFVSSHPDVGLAIESRSTPFNFTDDKFDIAIHFGQPTWAGGDTEFLMPEAVIPVASPQLLRTLSGQDSAIFPKAPLLHLTTRPKLWIDWCEFHSVDLENIYRGIRFDQFSMLIAAAMAGLGIALLPAYLIEEEMDNGLLVSVSDSQMTTENAYYIVRPEETRSDETADLFEKWLFSEIKQVNKARQTIGSDNQNLLESADNHRATQLHHVQGNHPASPFGRPQ